MAYPASKFIIFIILKRAWNPDQDWILYTLHTVAQGSLWDRR